MTALNPVLGYDRVARITATALEEHAARRSNQLKLAYLSGEEYDRLVGTAAATAVTEGERVSEKRSSVNQRRTGF